MRPNTAAELLDARYDRDDFEKKVETLTADPVPLVSFTFGCPPKDVVLQLQAKNTEVWVTVTTPEEAHEAAVRDLIVNCSIW